MIRQARRLLRLARLAGHMLAGMFLVYPLLSMSQRFGRRDLSHYQHAASGWWAGKLCRILNLSLSVRGEISAVPTLFVANHISWLDSPCLRNVLNAVFVAKQEVREWPLIGGMAVRTGTLFLKRGENSAQVADQMTAHLLNKHSVLFFPEGTSTDGRSLHCFYARLYQAAIRASVPVQAVAVTYPHPDGVHPLAPFIGDDTLLGNLWNMLAEPAMEIGLHFCEPIAAGGRQRRPLAEHTRSQILWVINEAHSLHSRTARAATLDSLEPEGVMIQDGLNC
ncbi:MAG: lysophospholipid acyltransferase family protein [Gammaproteobacteria bacterium]